MNDLSIRIIHRAEQDCNPAETTIEIGRETASYAGIAFDPDAGRDPDPATLVPGDTDDMAEALTSLSLDLGCPNTLEDMLFAIDALRAQAPQKLEWSGTLCDGKGVNYATAEKACAALGEGWRLPTRMELESILDLTRHDPAIDTARFPDTKSGWYWTSTPCAWSSDYAWIVSFGLGLALGYLRVNDNAFVRAVRSVPAGQ
jgi:hypothetical protein